MGYKTIDGLMRHLRASGIAISGSKQKRQLRNTGYFHGYKGYRFFEKASNRLPFSSYEEINATIQYDSKLKNLMYGKMMFIETAVKNVALESILQYVGSESIQDMYNKAICSYKNCMPNATVEQKKKAQENRLALENKIQANLIRAYKDDNPKITHFYNNFSHSSVPIWALFEIISLGDFGFLLSCLTYDVRKDISRRLGIISTSDTDFTLIYKYIYALKDLRNAIAHNSVVFDTRFRRFDPTKAMKRYLEQEINVPYVNFKSIGDYIMLMCYYMKLLGTTKTEMKAFVKDFERITDEYKKAVPSRISTKVIRSDLSSRMAALKKII